jgi:hypothetical protein
MSVDKKLKLKAEKDTPHFKAGDVVAGPLAFIYLGGRALSSVSWYAGQLSLWVGGRVVETASPRFHKWSLNGIQTGYKKSTGWLNRNLNTPNTAFLVAAPLVAVNVGVPLAATAILIAKPFTSLISSYLVYKSATAAKLVKFLLPVTYATWQKAEGSKGHTLLNPVFQKTGEQLKRLDVYCEDKVPLWKRTKDLLQKAPLSETEKTILKPMPKVLRKLPKMERAGVLAHHFTEVGMEMCGLKEPDTTYVEPYALPMECFLEPPKSHVIQITQLPASTHMTLCNSIKPISVGKTFRSAGSVGQIIGDPSRKFLGSIVRPKESALQLP